MQGFPNLIKSSLEEEIFPTPKPVHLPDNPVRKTIYYCETPPKPVEFTNIIQSHIKSPSSPISPFTRYTRKQNESLLAIIESEYSSLKENEGTTDTDTSSNTSKDGDILDQYGFYVEMSEKLFQMNNTEQFNVSESIEDTWNRIISENIPLDEIPDNLIHKGIPQSCRKNVWHYLCCCHEENKQNILSEEENIFDKLKNASNPESSSAMEYQHYKTKGEIDNPNRTQIMLDLSRTFPTHQLYYRDNTEGQTKLYNVLMAYSIRNPTIGYCQGMSYVAGLLLMYYSEAESFWMLDWLLHDERLGKNYVPSMEGIITNANLFDELLKAHYPLCFNILQKTSIHPLMYMTGWYMTMFTQFSSWPTILQFFDLTFYYGPEEALFRFSLGLFHICQKDILKLKSMEKLLPYLQNIPINRCQDPILIPVCCSFPISQYITLAKTKLEEEEQIEKEQAFVSTPKQTLQTPTESRTVSNFFDKVIGTFSTPKKTPKQTSGRNTDSTYRSRKRPLSQVNPDSSTPLKRRKLQSDPHTPLTTKSIKENIPSH